jgi:hypothetical protein
MPPSPFFPAPTAAREYETVSPRTTTTTMTHNVSTALLTAFRGLRIASAHRPAARAAAPVQTALQLPSHARLFSASAVRMGTWLEPSLDRNKKKMKGRVRVATGGSTKGTTVMWGDYGLRMDDSHRRISAKHLKMAEDTIKNRLRGEKYRLYKRVACNIGVFIKGNEVSRREPWIPAALLLEGTKRLRSFRHVWVRERVASITGRPGLP